MHEYAEDPFAVIIMKRSPKQRKRFLGQTLMGDSGLKKKEGNKQAFVMGYFRSGPGQCHKTEKLHYAYSRDGLHWYELHENRAVYTSPLGEGILRDPFIAKGQDGFWHLVYTVRPRGTRIGYARSADLITWTDEKLLEVMGGMENVQNSWAPEFSYDKAHDNYLIYWASSIGKDLGNSKHYCVRTRDWETLGKTELFFDPGYQTIDATLTEWNGKYYMGVKDESHVYNPEFRPLPPHNQLASAEALGGPYRVEPDIRTPDYTEGPEFLQVGDTCLLIYDYWAYGRFGIMATQDIKHWRELEEDELRFPFQARHATVFPVNEQELQKLLIRYGQIAYYPTATYNHVHLAEEADSGFLHDAFSMKTVYFSFEPLTSEGTQYLYQEGGRQNGLALRLKDGMIQAASCSNGEMAIVEAPFEASSGQHRLAFVYNEGLMELYLDGNKIGSVQAPFRLIHAHSEAGGYGGRFAQDAFDDCKGNYPFQGKIDNMRLFSVPLQEQDIMLLNKTE